MRLVCESCNHQDVVDGIISNICPNCKLETLNFVHEPIWVSRAIIFFKNAPKNIINWPYTFIESLNWVLKQINIYFSWPLSILIILFIISFFNFPPGFYWPIVAIIVIGMIFIGHYLTRLVYKRLYRVDMFGEFDDQSQWFKGTLNQNIRRPKYWIGFVGDIMRMKKYNLKFGSNLKRFFRGTKLVVGNLEGIISLKKEGFTSQNHRYDIFDNLLELNRNWLLCMSNNHSGDFGYEQFIKTCEKAHDKGIEVFGFRKNPCFPDNKYLNNINLRPNYLKIMDKINIVSGTMWRNHSKSCNYISLYEWKNSYYDKTKFNILYPHWHYENEDYVRLNIQKKCTDLMKYGDDNNQEKPWDLIFGHHPHVPQMVTMIGSANPHIPNKLLAYSGGNFTSGAWRDKHNHGLIMKCEIGRWTNGKLAVGDVHWSYIKIDFENWKKWKKNSTKTVIIDKKQNAKKFFFIFRKRILINVYLSLLSVPIIIMILFLYDFEIEPAKFFFSLGVLQLGFLGYIIIVFRKRHKFYFVKNNNNATKR